MVPKKKSTTKINESLRQSHINMNENEKASITNSKSGTKDINSKKI